MSRRLETMRLAAAGDLGGLRWAIAMQPGDGLAKLILIIMACAANTSWECYLSVANIAAEANCSTKTVERKIRYLLLRGYVEDISDLSPERRTRTYRLCRTLELRCG